MMMSPESYYEEHLKGKTPEQIMTAIRSLKREIGRLKRQPIDMELEINPSIDVQILCSKEYLERAKQALVEAGGTYTPTKKELAEAAFKARIPFLRRITLTRSSFCCGRNDIHVVIVENECCYIALKNWSGDVPSKEDGTPIYKDEFLQKLDLLDLYEWKHRYIDYDVLDGEQWELLLDFSDNGKPIKIYGSNKYPDNFYDLEELFDLDSYSEYDED